MLQTYVTADELYAMPDDGFRYELVRGELVKMPPAGFEHCDAGAEVLVHLRVYAKAKGLGRAVGADTGFRLAEDHVLAPDVAFVSQSRLPVTGLPERFFPGVPDLAVEVISPSGREPHIDRKVDDYFHYGCQMVVFVRPRTRTVEVHTPDREVQVLEMGDVLDGGEVVPGWQLPVAQIFDYD